MKKFLITILILLFLGIASFFYYIYLSPRAQSAKINWERINNITLGMDTIEVIEIMGEPDHRYNYNDGITFYYENAPLESESPKIVFDSLGIVIGYMTDSLGNRRYIY